MALLQKKSTFHEQTLESKLYIPSTINIWKKVLTKAIGGNKKWAGLDSACTSSKTEILYKIGFRILFFFNTLFFYPEFSS